jgi:hypothetical protein
MVALNSESTTLSVASCNLIRRLSVDFSVSAFAPAETLSDSDYPFFGIFIYKSTFKKPKKQVYLDVSCETLCTKILAFSASCTHRLSFPRATITLLHILRQTALAATLLPSSSLLLTSSPIFISAMSSSSLNPSSCLQVKFLSETATMPTRGSPDSAGFDLSSAEKTVVPAGGRAVVKTDLSVACPPGTYARIAPRR